MDDDDDPHSDVSRQDALELLGSFNGDQYIGPETAREIVAGFTDGLEATLGDDHDAMQNGELWLNRYVATHTKLAMDARGIPTIPQYDPLVVVEDLSAALADDLDIEPGEGRSTGHARNAREAHTGTLQNLRDAFQADTEA